MSAEEQLFVPEAWVKEYQDEQVLKQAEAIIEAAAYYRFFKVAYAIKRLAGQLAEHLPHALPKDAPAYMSDHFLRPEERLPRFGSVPDVYTQQWTKPEV